MAKSQGFRIWKSVAISGIAQYVSVACNFIKIAVISRILTPEEIGIFAICMSLIFLARVLRFFGTWDYIVSTDNISTPVLKTCYTITLILSLAMAIIFYSTSDLMATFFSAPELSLAIKILTISFLLSPLTSIAPAIMTREMRFGQLAIIQISTAVVETICVIAFAIIGLGLLSLVYGFILGIVASAVTLFFLERRYMLMQFSLFKFQEIFRFGFFVTSSTLLTQIGQQAPVLIAGRSLGAVETSFYSRGQASITIFRQFIEVSTGRVSQSLFAELSRQNKEKLSVIYQKILTLTSGLSWPIYIALIFTAPTIIPIILGEQWQKSIAITQALAIGGIFTVFSFYGKKLLIGAGLVSTLNKFEITTQVTRIFLLIYSVNYGILYMAYALVVSEIISFIYMLILLRRTIMLSIGCLFKSLFKSLLLSATIFLLNILLYEFIFTSSELTIGELIIYITTCIVVYISMAITFKHPIYTELRRLAGIRC